MEPFTRQDLTSIQDGNISVKEYSRLNDKLLNRLRHMYGRQWEFCFGRKLNIKYLELYEIVDADVYDCLQDVVSTLSAGRNIILNDYDLVLVPLSMDWIADDTLFETQITQHFQEKIKTSEAAKLYKQQMLNSIRAKLTHDEILFLSKNML